MKVAIVILNWNGEKFLERFLPTVIDKTNQQQAEIYVIDNSSSDNSLKLLREKFSMVKIVYLDKNYGFAEGYNKGLSEIKAEYYLLLNSDVEVSDNWLSPLLKKMDSDKNIAVCGPKLLDFQHPEYFEYAGAAGGFVDKYGYPFCRGRIFENIEEDSSQYNEDIDCMWVSGAALLVRAELYNFVGGFDKEFFAHQEEIDLCWRLKNLGYRVVCVPESFVFHVGGATLNKSNPHKTFLNFRNNLFLIYKNFPTVKRQKVLFIRFFLDIIAAFRMILQSQRKDFSAVCKAYLQFWKNKNKISRPKQIKNPKTLSGF